MDLFTDGWGEGIELCWVLEGDVFEGDEGVVIGIVVGVLYGGVMIVYN